MPRARHLSIELGIRQQERAGEVVREMDLDELAGLGMLATVPLENRLVELFLVEERERDRVSELEGGALLEEIARNGENAILGVPRPDHGGLRALSRPADADTGLVEEPPLEVFTAHAAPEGTVPAKLLSPLLERAKPIVMLLEEVGDFVVGVVVESTGVVVGLALTLGDARHHVVELTARVLVEIEKRGDGGDHPGLGADAREILLAQIERTQQRVIEQSRESVVDVPLAEALHELLDRDAVEFERLEQQRKLDDALALLDEAQIGRRDLETSRHLALLEPSAKPKLPQALPHRRIRLCHGGLYRNFTKFSSAIEYEKASKQRSLTRIGGMIITSNWARPCEAVKSTATVTGLRDASKAKRR